jgi:hypothetical protein
MSLKDDYRQDPPGEHWRNPYLDHGWEFCGHCGDPWPCEAIRDLADYYDTHDTSAEMSDQVTRLMDQNDEPLRRLADLVYDGVMNPY